MTAYLLNTTTIWLLSLICFDLFLKRETYHGYNRAYLLFTLLAGIFMPLYTRPSFASTTVTQQPLQRVDKVRSAIVETTTPYSNSQALSAQAILQWIYIAGVAVSILFLLREIILLFRYYHTGIKTKSGRYTIVETGRNHGPFSVGKIIFVSAEKNYDADQWQIVLRHEQKHSELLHLADMIVIQVIQVVFWFHPLVYLYRRQLLLAHEYQADAGAALQPLQYGNFLVEQSLLHPGPLPAHSFNRSPIKNRLRMLTRNASSKMARIKYWFIAPVLLAGLLCCAKAKEQHQKRKTDKNTIVYKGNTFSLTKLRTETIKMMNPKTGAMEEMKMDLEQYPIRMNGRKIYTDDGIKEENMPVYLNGSLERKILDAVRPELEQLPDANNYTIAIFNPIVDEKGNLVYFDIRGLEQYFSFPPDSADRADIKPELKATVAAKVNDFLDDTHKFKPATLEGKPVVCVADLKPLNFSVQNHKVTYDIK